MSSQGADPIQTKLTVADVAELQTVAVNSLKQGSIAYVIAEDTGAGPYFKFMPFSTAAGGGANVKYAATALVNGTGVDALAGRWIRLSIIDHA